MRKSLFKVKMVENFSDLGRDLNIQVHEANHCEANSPIMNEETIIQENEKRQETLGQL